MTNEEKIRIIPCCKNELPAPIEGVASITCGDCGAVYTPEEIEEYNEMIKQLKPENL